MGKRYYKDIQEGGTLIDSIDHAKYIYIYFLRFYTALLVSRDNLVQTFLPTLIHSTCP